jgi:hypothetical protein
MAYAIDIADSDSVNLGSNPSPPASQFKPPPMSPLARARRLVRTPTRSRSWTKVPNYWSPGLQALGHTVGLLPPSYVKPIQSAAKRRHTGRRTAQPAYSPCALLNSSSAS